MSNYQNASEERTPTTVILSRSEGSPGLDRTGVIEDRRSRLPIAALQSITPGDPSLQLRMTVVGVRSSLASIL